MGLLGPIRKEILLFGICLKHLIATMMALLTVFWHRTPLVRLCRKVAASPRARSERLCPPDPVTPVTQTRFDLAPPALDHSSFHCADIVLCTVSPGTCKPGSPHQALLGARAKSLGVISTGGRDFRVSATVIAARTATAAPTSMLRAGRALPGRRLPHGRAHHAGVSPPSHARLHSGRSHSPSVLPSCRGVDH